MNNKTTGSFISARRKELSLNQKQLAEKLGVTDKAVSKWETGRSAPDIALLEPLARELGVSVVEILQGEKIEEENFPAVSDEVVVTTMKKDKKKLKRAVIIAVSIMLSILVFLQINFYCYHYFTTIPENDITAIEKQATEYIKDFSNIYEYEFHNGKIVKSVEKGKYHFYLIEGTNEINEKRIYLCIFRNDDVFKKRIEVIGGSLGISYSPNEIHHHCSGEGSDYGCVNFNVFYGYDMQESEYSFYYRGVKYTVPIEDGIFLHPFVDIDSNWTNANLIYND
ncbi:MAG: helix-turn-helix transcriptional regulator [Clostridia bacterium]|nr:helix-turn-helix transcriptional regulator [Clostridia bacterium]